MAGSFVMILFASLPLSVLAKEVIVALEINEFNRAENSISEMKSATNLEEYEDHWKDFLTYLDRAWNKCEDSISNINSVHKIRDFVRRCRKEDNLIQYLVQARNVNEHTIRRIVTKKGACATITGGPGGGIIIRGSIEGSGKVNTLVRDGNVEIKFLPARLEVVAVKNKSTIFQPPKEHLGATIHSLIPHELAEMGFSFYKKNIGDIKELLT